MIDEDIAYLSPSTVYNILKKHEAERKVKYRDPVEDSMGHQTGSEKAVRYHVYRDSLEILLS